MYASGDKENTGVEPVSSRKPYERSTTDLTDKENTGVEPVSSRKPYERSTAELIPQ